MHDLRKMYSCSRDEYVGHQLKRVSGDALTIPTLPPVFKVRSGIPVVCCEFFRKSANTVSMSLVAEQGASGECRACVL